VLAHEVSAAGLILTDLRRKSIAYEGKDLHAQSGRDSRMNLTDDGASPSYIERLYLNPWTEVLNSSVEQTASPLQRLNLIMGPSKGRYVVQVMPPPDLVDAQVVV
jgi:hypothetical protein